MKVRWWVTQVWFPTVICVGLITNVFSIVMLLCSSQLKKVSPAHYISARAGVDSAFLLTLLLVWLAQFDHSHEHLYLVVGWCQFVSYGSHLSQFLATWTTSALTLDRAVFVLRPDKRKTTCTPMRARAVIVGLVVLAMVVYLNMSLTEGVITVGRRFMCSPLPRFMSVMRVLGKLDAIVNFLVPYTGIIVTAVLLRSHLCSRSRAPRDAECQIIVDIQMTRTSMCVSLWFIILTLPSQIFRFHHLIRGATRTNEQVTLDILIAQQILNFPSYTSYCSVFFTLVFTEQNFRKAICSVFTRCSSKSKDQSDPEAIPMASSKST